MTDPRLFWTIFAAVLGAIMLGGAFFWGLISYTKLEREGRDKTEGGLQLGMILMPLAFLILALWTAFAGKGFGHMGDAVKRVVG